jgi:hypothetical protein
MEFIVMLMVLEEERSLCITIAAVHDGKFRASLQRDTVLQLDACYAILACLPGILELLQTLQSYLCSGKRDKAVLWGTS